MARTLPWLVSALLLLALAAFWPRYLGRPFRTVDGWTHLHAAFGLLWLLLLIVQPLLVQVRRVAWHRSLGRASWAVALAFAASGVLLAHARFSAMDEPTFQAEAPSLYLPLFSTACFLFAYLLGQRHRRIPPVHGRLMAATALLLIDPVLGRILFFHFPALPAPWVVQAITFGLTDTLAAGLLLSHRGPGRAALRSLLLALVAAHLLWFTFAPTAPWSAFARWFRGLPLT